MKKPLFSDKLRKAKLFRKVIKAMMTMKLNGKENKQMNSYSWNNSIQVRPYAISIATVASVDDCDFTGRLGHLEPKIGRLRS